MNHNSLAPSAMLRKMLQGVVASTARTLYAESFEPRFMDGVFARKVPIVIPNQFLASNGEINPVYNIKCDK